MDDYESMLDEGREELPEEVFEGKRFETPSAETTKRGNRTVITNFSDIAKKVNRDEKHFSKYLLKELGTAGHVDGDELVLQGSFRRGIVNKKLTSYCEDFVICDECNRPDTKIVKEKGVTMLKCEACGARKSLED